MESSEDLNDNMLQSPFENLHKSDASDPTGANGDKNGENGVDMAPVQHGAEVLVTHQRETTGRLCESDISAQLKHEEDLCDSIIHGIADLTDAAEILNFFSNTSLRGGSWTLHMVWTPAVYFIQTTFRMPPIIYVLTVQAF